MNQITNPDAQIEAMVNGNTARRNWEADNRRFLRQMADIQQIEVARKRRKACRRMIRDAGSCAVLGALILVSMSQQMVAPRLALPLAGVCFLMAALRVDRYLRR